jgi:hypothetical protein
MANYWWVNQGHGYEDERGGGFLFASETDSRGSVPEHWRVLKELRPDDIVFHVTGGSIRSLGRVRSRAERGPHPDHAGGSFSGNDPSPMGNVVSVEYLDLDAPIRLEEIPAEWRTPDMGPFTAGTKRSGTPTQTYASPLSGDFVAKVVEMFSDRLPIDLR